MPVSPRRQGEADDDLVIEPSGGTLHAPHVTIIVPTYRSGSGLDRVVASLDAQTMPQEDFEVIFVDDGSPDDTWDRLKRIRATHGNVRIERIENSGWPSRPRNVALELARGEYVVFMDHDDELPPHALEAAYELGHRNGADAVNGKESLTRFPGWALGIYTENIDNAIGRIAPIPLMPLNPHKMYRRQFLLDHGIRFPEGRRHIWEDIFFNVEVYAHARVISVLSDTAFYHWVTTGENNSASYGADHAEHWGFLDRLLAFIDEQLADERHREARTALLLQQYQRRALSFFFSHVNAKSPTTSISPPNTCGAISSGTSRPRWSSSCRPTMQHVHTCSARESSPSRGSSRRSIAASSERPPRTRCPGPMADCR